ncbi:hypothetical protein HZI73_19325 [Vallitalea pronyensis]|uniref:Uncharacterized protein n=1 Tax=Vallitalea pronyensis TaxID=1348613 RepID=A0A8J8MMB8_9FIRM|nr:hypothetical protein [Vallitalea pronyensis]QUI24315.1 hypothetical protein HZI73_19325 [Vallitalea pronyensis]
MYKEISQLKKCTDKEKQKDGICTKVESSDRIDFEKNQHAYKESVQRLKQEGIREIVLHLWLT